MRMAHLFARPAATDGLVRLTVRVACAGTMAALLTACGVRGSLEAPKAQDDTATAESAQGKAEGAAAKPHKGFILDGLIR